MSLLDPLFQTPSGDPLVVYPTTLTEDTVIDAGYLYRVQAYDDDRLLELRDTPASAVAGKRFAIKIVGVPEGSPGPFQIDMLAEGMLIENDAGNPQTYTVLDVDATRGTYREYLCSPDGVWMLVSRIDGEPFGEG